MRKDDLAQQYHQALTLYEQTRTGPARQRLDALHHLLDVQDALIRHPHPGLPVQQWKDDRATTQAELALLFRPDDLAQG